MVKLKIACLVMLLALSHTVFSQSGTIKGNVKDELGAPLPGVSVMVKGTDRGAITNALGDFSVPAEVGETLVLSFLGYEPQTIVIANNESINVSMVPKISLLEEVVVVGYGTQKKKLLTGANLDVKGDKIKELNTPSVMEGLQGIAPGVSITRNNGAPGAGTRVRIRGIGTNGNSNPLYVVDGVYVGSIDYLSPTDIESVSVLKDAASAAIYGARAANGVILVTTKSGRKGAPMKVYFDSYYGFQNVYKNVDPLNAQEYMQLINEGRFNDGLPLLDWETTLRNNLWLDLQQPGLGGEYGDYVWNQLQNGWQGTNWIDAITNRNAAQQFNSVNITGSGENITYSAAVSYLDQEGIIGGDLIGAGLKRLTVRLNSEATIVKNADRDIIKFGERITYTSNRTRNVRTGNVYWNDLHNAIVQNPLQPVRWNGFNNEFGFAPNLDGVDPGQSNPAASLFYTNNFGWGTGHSVNGNVYLSIEPIENLVIQSKLGVNLGFGHSRGFSPTFGLGQRQLNSVSAASQSQWLNTWYTVQHTASYNRSFGDHNLSAVVGFERNYPVLNTNVGANRLNTISNDPDEAFLDNTFPPQDITQIQAWGRDWAAIGGGIQGILTRLSYNYKEKYLFDATVRRDGSSNFADGFRFGVFPSFSAGWLISNEDFMAAAPKQLNSLKLRASWGQNGNNSVGSFLYSATVGNIAPAYFFGNNKPVSSPGTVINRVPNPNISWETSEQINVGFDALLYDSRLAFTFDWYKKTTRDWLVTAPDFALLGAAPPVINGGEIENSGFEIMLDWQDEIGDIDYGITLSSAFNDNEVTRIENDAQEFEGPTNFFSTNTPAISIARVGSPIGVFYGYRTDGILQNQDEVDAYVNSEGAPYFPDQRPGDVRFVDLNGDGVINEEDKTIIGNPTPDFEMGLQLNLGWKNFYMNSTLVGKFGMQVMNSYRDFNGPTMQNYTSFDLQRWHGEGTSNRMPRLSASPNRNANFISDIYVYDADYVRIQNLTVGYNFKDLLNGLDFFDDLKFYVQVTNLHTFTGYHGMDPEVGYGGGAPWASGVDLGLYPLPRTVIFGINASF